MRKALTLLTILLATLLFASSCSGDPDPSDDASGDADDPIRRNDDGEVVIDIDGDEIVLTSGLSGFDDCDSLLDHLRTEAAQRVGPWGFDGGAYGPMWRNDALAVEETADVDMDSPSGDFTASSRCCGRSPEGPAAEPRGKASSAFFIASVSISGTAN